MQFVLLLILLLFAPDSYSKSYTGSWYSTALGKQITYHSTESSRQAFDATGGKMTVVYLENLAVDKVGQNTNTDDVAWLLSKGYSVVELDYAHDREAVSPQINQDIISINDMLVKGTFGGLSKISNSRAYILFEGYRIDRDVSYCEDNPTVYNFPDGYTNGDSLYMDIVYPANPKCKVPAVLSFSYSNSWHGKSHQRMYLPYTLSMFDDTILEGLPGIGYAWAIADHPKYCDWGNGKYTGGANKSLGTVEVCPDAAVKVRSAIRTLRHIGVGMGMSGEISLFGFSRGSTAASLAIGDKPFADWLDTTLCRPDSRDTDCRIKSAILGPGIFDYSLMSPSTKEYQHVSAYCGQDWTEQGGARAIKSGAVPCFLFYNISDDPEYHTQMQHLMHQLDSTHTSYTLLKDFGTGHSIPTTVGDIEKIYHFLHSDTTTGVSRALRVRKNTKNAKLYTLSGDFAKSVSATQGILISRGRKFFRKG